MIRSKKEQRNLCDAYKSNDLRKIKKEVCAPAPMEGVQNPAWSEEDKENLYHINALIKDSSLEVYRQEYLSNWIEALSKKKHWKPSDEQIRPLEYAIDYFKKKKNDTTYLESLYQDLMKLREE